MDLGGGETVHCRTFLLLVPKMHVFSWKIYGNYPNHLKSLNPFQNLLSKLVRCTRNCNACSWHWSKQKHNTPQCLTACHTTNASKVEQIELWSSASSTIFTWSLANWLPLLQASGQLFAGKMLPHPAGGRKCFPRAHQTPKHRFLYYSNKLISCWQKCVDYNGSYFD